MKLYATSANVVLKSETKGYTYVHQMPSFLIPGENEESVARRVEKMVRDLAGDRFVSCDAAAVFYRESW